jgi:hypothetical protein
MRTLLNPLVLAACLLGSGCQFVCDLGKNLVREPLLACDEKMIKHRSRKLAKQAWNEMVRQHGDSFSCEYRDGFVDGFADYLFYGGCVDSGGCCAGEGGACGTGTGPVGITPGSGAAGGSSAVEYPVCPAVPPPKYRRKRFMTPEGYAAVEDWYAGFKHGASTAMASGLRNLVVLPVQCPPAFGPDDSFEPPRPSHRKQPTTPSDTPPPMPPPEEITKPGSDPLPPPAPDANPLPALPPRGS